MKKSKTILTKTVCTTIAASLLASSCSSLFDENVYGAFSENKDEGERLLDLNNSNLSKEVIQTITHLTPIVNEIVTNKESAKVFAQNPEAYLKGKELAMHIFLNDKEKNLLLAFADKDISAAIEAKDFRTFINIGIERGYLGAINNKTASDLKSYFKSDEEFNTFVGNFAQTKAGNFDQELSWFVAAFAVIVAAVAAYLIVVVEVGFWGYVQSDLNQSEPVLNLWDDKSVLEGDITLWKEIIDPQVEIAEEALRELEPNLSESQIQDVSSMIRINIEGYYGLRK